MTKLTKAALIWNRVLDCAAGAPFGADLELETMLRIHGYVMNGGIFHAVENRDLEDLTEAESAYRY